MYKLCWKEDPGQGEDHKVPLKEELLGSTNQTTTLFSKSVPENLYPLKIKLLPLKSVAGVSKMSHHFPIYSLCCSFHALGLACPIHGQINQSVFNPPIDCMAQGRNPQI